MLQTIVKKIIFFILSLAFLFLFSQTFPASSYDFIIILLDINKICMRKFHIHYLKSCFCLLVSKTWFCKHLDMKEEQIKIKKGSLNFFDLIIKI